MPQSAAARSSAQQGLPFIDISRLHGSQDEKERFAADLREVLHKHGFFYLTGHGVDPALIEKVLSVSRRFFALPLEEKLKIEMVKSRHFRGYNRAGYERTKGQQDWREQVDINTESEPVEIGPDTPPWKRLLGPNQWPEALPELKPILLEYQAEVTRIGLDVIKAIARGAWPAGGYLCRDLQSDPDPASEDHPLSGP